MATRSAWNRAYYGREEAAQQIVISMDANNPGASPLREVLGRFGPMAAPPPVASNDSYAPQPVSQMAQAQPVQSQTLPPSRRAPVQQQSLPVRLPNPNRY